MATQTQSKNNPVETTSNHIMISNDNHFAILEKRPNVDGYQGVTFSINIARQDIDVIDKSGIAQVMSPGESQVLFFTRKSFYENSKMVELIIDILKRHE